MICAYADGVLRYALPYYAIYAIILRAFIDAYY